MKAEYEYLKEHVLLLRKVIFKKNICVLLHTARTALTELHGAAWQNPTSLTYWESQISHRLSALLTFPIQFL